MPLCEFPIPFGTRMELQGLRLKPELNGQLRVVVSFVAYSISAL